MDDNYALAVRYTLRAFTRALAVVASPSGLTTAEFRLLRTLGESGGATQAELAAQAAMDRPYVSALVRNMSARGLLEPRRNATDRRRTDIMLTAAGNALLAAVSKRLAEVNREAVHGVDSAELAVFLAVMARVRRNLRHYEAAAPAREDCPKPAGS